jgi:hypothetical protein
VGTGITPIVERKRRIAMKGHIKLLGLLLVIALAACSKPPSAEMKAAEAAVARAGQSADVVSYSPEDLQRSKTALDQMHAAATARHYDQAKTFAAEATSAANAAIASAQSNKDRAKARAIELIDAVKQALPQTQKTLAAALKIKKANINRSAKTASIEESKAGLADAEKALGQGDYLNAITKASAAQKILADLSSELSAAVQGATRKK